MTLKTIILAGVTAASLTAPLAVAGAASAQPYWDHDRGYEDRRDDWRRDEWRREHWRRNEYRAYDRWDGRYNRGYGRCFTEQRGYYNWRGDYVSRPVEVCR